MVGRAVPQPAALGVNENVLADLVIGGSTRKVLLHPDRNGYMYVVDRASGEILSATPFVHVTTTTGIDLKTGRPVEVEEKRPGFGKVPAGRGQGHAAGRLASRVATSVPGPAPEELGAREHAVAVAVEDRERAVAPGPLRPGDHAVMVPVEAAETTPVAPDAHALAEPVVVVPDADLVAHVVVADPNAALLALVVITVTVAVAPLPPLVSVGAAPVSPALVLSMVRPRRRE
jgi:hypothetical protein